MASRTRKANALLLSLALAASACTANPKAERPSFANDLQASEFIDEMVEKHGMDKAELEALFAEARMREDIIKAISRPAESKPWYEYRPIFLTQSRIDGGVAFWEANEAILAKAEKAFGVDAQVIVAIIGVETRYGGNAGSYRVIDALSTLAFGYPKRGKFFRGELEQFLLLTTEEQVDRTEAKGSYAGAMGYGQFIPSSYRAYAVDFDEDGRRDLWASKMDIIGSVANYLHVHGWELGATVVQQAEVNGGDTGKLTKAGLKPSIPTAELKANGVVTDPELPANGKSALIELEQKDGPEFWVGHNNFYVITRYNRSPLYAMAVYQLSEEIRAAREADAAL